MIKASNAQLRMIYSLAKKLGMDNDLLHSYIEAKLNKSSISKLSVYEATLVIKGLKGEDTDKKSNISHNPKGELMSKKQRDMLIYLAHKLGWIDEKGGADIKRLDAFVRKEYSTLYFFNLSRSNACKCIEVFKSMSNRDSKKVV